MLQKMGGVFNLGTAPTVFILHSVKSRTKLFISLFAVVIIVIFIDVFERLIVLFVLGRSCGADRPAPGRADPSQDGAVSHAAAEEEVP